MLQVLPFLASHLLSDMLSSALLSKSLPDLGMVPRAARVVTFPEYTSCVPEDDSDDFDYSCQQSSAAQVIIRGGKPLVVDQSWGSSASTGASLWPSSIVLSRYMEELGVDYWKGKSVVELGSGVGLNSLTVEGLGAGYVTVTDGDKDVLAIARANMESNYLQRKNFDFRLLPFLDDRGESSSGSIVDGSKRGASDPGKFDVIIGSDLTYNRGSWGPFDVIIGSDLTYNRGSWGPFVRTVSNLAGPQTIVFYATAPRYRDEWSSLKSQFEMEGFTVRDIQVRPRSKSGGVLTEDIRVLELRRLPVSLPNTQVT